MTHSGTGIDDAGERKCPLIDTREHLADSLTLLEQELRNGVDAASRLDLPALELHTRLAADLCQQVQCLQLTFNDVEAGGELQASASMLADLCGGYRVLLQKSRRTINILMNVLATASVAYSPGVMRPSLVRDFRL